MKNRKNRESITISGRKIGLDYPPYIVAEVSANHNGDFERAIEILIEAHRSGADAVKLQTYKPETITLNSDSDDFQIKEGLWSGQTLYDLYEKAHMPWDWHKPLFDKCHELGITIFSSPFDNSAVDLLEDLNAPAYKIASFEAIDLALIKYVAQTGKPMIISTGMADSDEIHEAIEAAESVGCKELAILHCVSSYPAEPEQYNLNVIPDMIKRYRKVAGLSDHTLGYVTAITSIATGASIIEKHFTLDRKAGGADDSFSMEPDELKELCNNAETAWKSLGKVDYGLKSSEKGNIKFRRSLYFVKNMKSGDVIKPDDIRSVRPGFGLAPKNLENIIGKKLKKDVLENTPVSWDHIN